MLREFKRYIADNNMLDKNSRVLLTVSGGVDSMVMAHLFRSAGIISGIAHCNFRLRGKESDLDENLVRQYAMENDMPFYSIRFDTKAYASKKGLSVQMAARELRYKWFEETRTRNGYDLIAVAHNLNDNIETLIINLTRGTGLSGLTGIRPVSNRIIRPLLFATRTEIEACCKKNSIVFREDKSNAETRYTRNKIRHLIIPVLKEINPAIEKTLSETIARLRGADEIVEGYIRGLRESLAVNNGDNLTFRTDLLENLSKSILFELFSPFGLSGTQTDDLTDVIKGRTGGQLFTPSHRIIKDRNKIIVLSTEQVTSYTYRADNLEELKGIPIIQSAEVVTLTESFVIPEDTSIACLDSDEITYPIIIRKWKKGDFFFPLGMRHKKKLSDFFIDKKLSLPGKEKVMVLESEGRIVWVIGHRIDGRFRIKSSTIKALIIKSHS